MSGKLPYKENNVDLKQIEAFVKKTRESWTQKSDEFASKGDGNGVLRCYEILHQVGCVENDLCLAYRDRKYVSSVQQSHEDLMAHLKVAEKLSNNYKSN